MTFFDTQVYFIFEYFKEDIKEKLVFLMKD